MSIVDHIRRSQPCVSVTYLADNALFPYGLLDEQQLIDRVQSLVCQACERYNADIIVIGCNSASTLVLPHLRRKLSLPIVGVVPAIKPAAKMSSNKVIGLLATPGTINRDYTNGLISDFANKCEIIRVGSSELVELIEEKFRGVNHPATAYHEILRPLREHIGWDSLDTVILACTHFPLALNELSAAAPQVTHWIDSGEAIARQVKRISSTIASTTSPSNNIAVFTQLTSINTNLRKNLNRFGFSHVQQWHSKTI